MMRYPTCDAGALCFCYPHEEQENNNNKPANQQTKPTKNTKKHKPKPAVAFVMQCREQPAHRRVRTCSVFARTHGPARRESRLAATTTES